MPHRPGTRSAILAIALAWLALTAAQSAAAQVLLRDEHPDHAPCATEPEPGDGSWCYPKGPEIHVIVRQPLAEVIVAFGSDELRYRDALRSGKQPQPERTHYAKWLELSDAEDDAIREITLDADFRLRYLYPEIDKLGNQLEQHWSEELANKRFDLIAELQPIYDGVAQKLQEQVGERTLGRVEKYFAATNRKYNQNTTTCVYYYRRPGASVYLGEFTRPQNLAVGGRS